MAMTMSSGRVMRGARALSARQQPALFVRTRAAAIVAKATHKVAVLPGDGLSARRVARRDRDETGAGQLGR